VTHELKLSLAEGGRGRKERQIEAEGLGSSAVLHSGCHVGLACQTWCSTVEVLCPEAKRGRVEVRLGDVSSGAKG
jgi:hypothetical protein